MAPKKSASTGTKAALAEDIAKRLDAHLKRMEADPKFNTNLGSSGISRLYEAHAWADKGRIGYVLIAFHGSRQLALDRALGWVTWLDAGHNGLLEQFEKKHPPVTSRYVGIPAPDRRHRFDGLRGRRYMALEDAFYGLLYVLFPAVPKPERGERVHELNGWYYGAKGHGKPTYHVMSEEQQEAVEKLFKEIRNGIDTSFNDGKADGQDFLAQMIRGEVSLTEIGIAARPAKRAFGDRFVEPDED